MLHCALRVLTHQEPPVAAVNPTYATGLVDDAPMME